MKDALRQAFEQTRDGWSADRVVADPALNATFVEGCRKAGLDQPVEELNRALLNARKAGWLSGLPSSRRTSFANEDEYRFASEIAARFLEQRENTSLDQVICHPELAVEFDRLAESIAPGYTPLQYRWAALNLRKSRLLKPELLSHVVPADIVAFSAIDNIELSALPNGQGLYIFHSRAQTLYIGESINLRKRVEKHIDHSDNKGLAHWFWQHGFADVMLELRVLPADTTQKVRKALERELIESRSPVFNVQHNVVEATPVKVDRPLLELMR